MVKGRPARSMSAIGEKGAGAGCTPPCEVRHTHIYRVFTGRAAYLHTPLLVIYSTHTPLPVKYMPYLTERIVQGGVSIHRPPLPVR